MRKLAEEAAFHVFRWEICAAHGDIVFRCSRRYLTDLDELLIEQRPAWSPNELRIFFASLKTYGPLWDRMEERLPARSRDMIQALFDTHQSYLSRPDASVEGFCALVKNHHSEDVRCKKRRKLDRLLSRDVVVQTCTRQSATRHERKTMVRPMRRRQWFEHPDSKQIRSAKFDLPWYHWFYSFIDVDFFQHSEFLECLRRMGLENVRQVRCGELMEMLTVCSYPRLLDPSGARSEHQWAGLADSARGFWLRRHRSCSTIDFLRCNPRPNR